MGDGNQFTTDGGIGINWSRVTEVGVGTVFGAIFTGVVSIILGLADIPLALLGGLSDFLGTVVEVVAGLPALIMRGAWAETIPFILEAGIAGYVVAISIVLLTMYVVSWGVSKVG